MFFRGFYRSARDFNLFDSHSTDRKIVRRERWSTRLYIVTLSCAILVLLFYTCLNVTSTQIEFKNPSLNKTLDLFRLYPNIRCPCKKISTPYENFLRISTDFHWICSSVFVSDRWIDFLYDRNTTNFRYAADLRATLGHQFQILRELCRLAIDAVNNGRRTLSTNELISGQLLSKNLFETKIEAEIFAFQRKITENFLRELIFVRSLFFGNQLMPGIPTAFTLIVRSDSPGVIRSTPGINTDFYRDHNGTSCLCTDRPTCRLVGGFYEIDRFDFTRGVFDQTIRPPAKIFNRWFAGCWPMETLFLSNLDEFFNEILPLIDVNRTFFLPLNRSDEDETIEILVEKLFLRSFDYQWNYSSYFSQCQIDSCLLDANERASFLYIVTSLLGLYGGLSVALLFLVRLSTNIFRLDLNLFKSSQRTSPIDLRNQRWSTRVYLVCLTVSLLFLTLYTSLNVETKIVFIPNPSFSTVEKLQNSSISLECPCASLSTTYADLIELKAEFHQICSSEFVDEKWIEGLNRIVSLNVENIYFADFRYASPIFQLLKSMWQLANQTILDSLFVFGQTQLVTANLLDRKLFEKQLNSAIEQFQRTTPVALLHLLQLTRNFTFVNQFLTGTLGSFYVQYSQVGQNRVQPEIFLETHGASEMLSNGTTTNCSCANEIRCGRKAAIYTGPSGHRRVVLTIKGFYSRCWPLESLLPSTLECFYQTNSCLDEISQITNESFFSQIRRLNASKSSRFQQNSTIEELLSQLFVEFWSSKLFYSAYFSVCQPISCSYSVSTRKNVVELLTSITGLIGGLSVAFRLIIPRLISFLTNHRTTDETIRIRRKIWRFWTNFNVFELQHRSNVNEFELFLQRQSTRLYFLLLVLTFFILMIYTSLTYQNDNHSVRISSLNDFRKLENQFADCRCSKLSFARGKFSQIEPKFHPICSNFFVSNVWLDFLFENFRNRNSTAFVNAAFPHFQTLKLICDLTRQATIDALELFLTSDVVVASLLPEQLFHQWTKSTWNSFQSTFSQSFLHSFDMLRGISQGNALVSAYSTNWQFVLPNMSKDATIYMRSILYDRCDCATSKFCLEKTVPPLPGFFIGCLPIDAFLHSTFECFYNQTCLNSMLNCFPMRNFSLEILQNNSSRFENFLPNEKLVEQMFIESWSIDVSYERFFNECRPNFCSFTLISKYNLIYVITTIVGLYGGLTVFLKLIVPIFVRRIYFFVERHRRIAPQLQRF